MAKGAQAKEVITEKILATFPNSFKYDKEIRVPIEENGEEVQIKITLTCAKTNVAVNNAVSDNAISISTDNKNVMHELTESEKEKVTNLIDRLGL